MIAGLTVTVMAMAVLVTLDSWVYLDARARARQNERVEIAIVGYAIDQPRVWLAFCIVLFVIFFPLYLVALSSTN